MIGPRKRVAIIGGGVAGSCAANRLISLVGAGNEFDVMLFDQGGRGPGGRTSHRRVRRSGEFISLLQIISLADGVHSLVIPICFMGSVSI